MARKKREKRETPATMDTAVHVLLDMSSSMMDMWAETIDATNAFVEGLTAASTPSYVTVTVFGHYTTESGQLKLGAKDIMTNAPAYELPKITDEQYRPRGGTPLYQAIQRSIKTMETTSANSKVIIVLTDGEDSSGNPADQTKKAIAKFQKAGGLVLFLGCKQAIRYHWDTKLGINKCHILHFSSRKPVLAAKEAAMATLMFKALGKAEFSDEARGLVK